MVTVKILKKYADIVLERIVLPKEQIKVDIVRAKKLSDMSLVEIIKIDRVKKKTI